jgi:hypothetical protein
LPVSRKYWICKDGRFVGFGGVHLENPQIFHKSWLDAESGKIREALLRHITKESAKMGAKYFYAESSPKSQMNELYARLGFEKKLRIKDYWSKGSDLILFVKKL